MGLSYFGGMKTPLLVAALLATATAHAQQLPNPAQLKAPKQTRYDKQVFEATKNGIDMSVSFLDPAECLAEFERDAQLNRWSETQRQEEKAKIPQGGYLKASWSRDTPVLASADNFVFLIEAPDGREIRRWTPNTSIARPFSLAGVTVYQGITLVPLPEQIPDGAKVFVIEASSRKRFEYIIHP